MSRHISFASLAVAAIWPGILFGSDPAEHQGSGGSAEPDSGVMVQGGVIDHDTGHPVPGAAVSLATATSGLQGRGTRVADDEGHFLFRNVPEGAYRLTVTVQGYHPMADTVQVSATEDLELILPLSKDPIRLEAIVVTAKATPPGFRNYEKRNRIGSGFLVTREEIEKRQPRFLTELLHNVPGGMVVPTPPHGYTLLLRGQCRPGIWVDGVRLPDATSIDQLLAPQVVDAVEVYHGTELPVEFGVNPCGGVLIWTRMGTPQPADEAAGSRSHVIGNILKAAGLVLIMLVVTR